MMWPPPITICLFAGVACLGWLAVENFKLPPAANTAISAEPAMKTSEEDGDLEFPGEEPLLPFFDPALKEAVLARPLFSETRRPYEPEVFTDETLIEFATPEQDKAFVEEELIEETPPPSLPTFALSGVMTDSAHKSALISVDGSAPEWRHEGYENGHWRIEAVHADKVIIRGQSEDLIVELYPSQ